MAIEDYIPNVFGSVPSAYQGLLGTEETAALQRRSNIGGLLSAGAALAQGMSAQGPRRSALQNVLTALAAGYGGAGQASQASIEQMVNAQKLGQAQQQMAAINNLIKDPRVANDPAMIAYIRANPADAIKYFAENAPIAQILGGQQQAAAPVAAPSAPMYGEQGAEPIPQDGQLAPVIVSAPETQDSRLFARKNALLSQNEQLSRLPSKRADEILKRNNDEIATIDKQLDRFAVSGYDFNAIEAAVPVQFKERVRSLRKAAETGSITMNELTQRLQDIENKALDFVTKKTDYTNQDRRVAAGMFQGRPIEELNPAELMQLENKLYEMRIQERRAGATTLNMPSESERTAGFLTNRVINSLNQLQSVVGVNPTAASPKFSAEAVKFLTGSDYLKNLANPEARQQVEAAQLEILDAALTLGTGAAYTREQLENYRKSYFPQLGDKPANIKDKQQRLKSLLDSAMIKSGRAAPSTPSGVAPAFDMQAIEAELNRRKGK
jgi:hypothetical protein